MVHKFEQNIYDEVIELINNQALNENFYDDLFKLFGQPIAPFSDLLELFRSMMSTQILYSCNKILSFKEENNKEELQKQVYLLYSYTIMKKGIEIILTSIINDMLNKKKTNIIIPGNTYDTKK